MPSPAVAMILSIKNAIKNGAGRKELAAMCEGAIRELENMERTGDRTPPNVLEVRG